jgi:hypothetical protein
MASATATTSRNPAAVSGKVGTPEGYLSSLAILPLMPVTPDIVEKYRLNSPRETFVTYVQDQPDILEGDLLTVSSVDYRVRAVGEWPTDRDYLEIIVERVKGA